MARSDTTATDGRLFTLVAILVAVVGLYLGKEVLIPLALATLLSFLLAPLVRRLERLGLWRVPSVLLVTAMALTLVFAIGYALGGQIVELSNRLPQYSSAIHERITAVRSGAAGGLLGRASKNIEDIGRDLSTTQPASPTTTGPAPSTSLLPVPIQMVNASRGPLELVGMALGSLLSPLLTAGIVAIFTVFILVQREDLRDRLIRLAGEERLDATTKALDDTSRRISRYLLMQATVNLSMGVLVALGLWLIGLPNALLWGLLAAVLRFVPYIGIWIAAVMPIVLSLAVFPNGWLAPLGVVLLFLGLDLLIANVIEPLLYGGSTGLSPLAVLVAAIFWAWLWGPVGLLLSTPLTACLVVLGKYIPALSFLTVLLGDEPVLEPPSRFYQRLLAGDQEEAEDLAGEHLEENPLVQVYDDILLPALHLMEMDRHRGRLDSERLTAMHRSIREILEDLHDRQREIRPPPEPAVADGEASVPAGPPAPAESHDKPVQMLCLPARDESDELAAEMVVRVLGEPQIESRVLSADTMVSEVLEAVATAEVRVLCISAVPPEAMAPTRYLCKRLRARFPQVKIVVGFWDTHADPARIRPRLLSAGADHVVNDLAGLLQIVRPSTTSRAVST